MATQLTVSFNTQASDEALEQVAQIWQQYTFTHLLTNITFLKSAYPETYEWTILQDMSNYCLQTNNNNTNTKQYVFILIPRVWGDMSLHRPMEHDT